MSVNYRLEQSPIVGILGQAFAFGISVGGLALIFYIMDSAGTLFYGLALIAGLMALVTFIMPIMHASNLVSEIPEINEREDKDEIAKVFKVPHPLRWIIVMLNLITFVVFGYFVMEDINPETLGTWTWLASVLSPYLIATILAHCTVDIQLPQKLVNDYKIKLNS